VRTSDAREVKVGKAVMPKKMEWLTRLSPPAIQLDVDTSRGGVMANGDRFTLTGTVTDPEGLLDVYVLVNDQKVYFKAVDTQGPEPRKLKFTTDFALKEGNNNILVVAREDPDFASRKTLVVRRRPAEVAQKLAAPTPAEPAKAQ
jgi:carboxyl-terminal processing protease